MSRFFNPKALREGSGSKTAADPRSSKEPRNGEVTSRQEAEPALASRKPIGLWSNGRPGRNLLSGKNIPWAAPLGRASALAEPAPDQEAVEAEPRNLMVTVGNIALFLYLISGELNDLSHHFIGVNTYVSWVAEFIIAIALVTSGALLRGWKSAVGKLWIVLLLIMICTVPGSEWPRHSLLSVLDFFLRSIFMFFSICAFVVDARTLKTAILAEVVSGILLLISCVTMGGVPVESGRFVIPDSYFYAGPNDLAVALTAASGFFLYWTIQKNVLKVVFGGTFLLMAIYFLLKTGSRGGFLALAVLLAGGLVLSASYRWRLLPVLLLTPALFFLVPSDLIHRLGYIVINTETAQVTNEDEGASLASQEERTYMFWRSVGLMASHPILGVGMNCFMETIYREDQERNEHTHSVGTHNSYTQIGCECGIPALVLYITILWVSERRTYRVLRESNRLGIEAFPEAALCLITTVAGLAVALFFFHAAYASVVPLLTGLMAGLWQAYRHEQSLLPPQTAAA